MRTPVVVSWSGGKDSALLFQHLQHDPRYEIVGLLTTVTDPYDRISIHGVRRDILRAQVAELAVPLYEAVLPAAASNRVYERAFVEALARMKDAMPSLQTVAFGDLFLEEVRSYRERLLARVGWTPIFPLWGLDTGGLARRFVREGFQAIVCCVDTTQMAAAWAGRDFDAVFLDELPPDVDPCGERGEFHTCVHAGPIFPQPIRLARGERVRREARFEYCDLLLENAGAGGAAA